MELEKSVEQNLNLLNSVLHRLGVCRVLENTLFTLDESISTNRFLRFTVNKVGSIRLSFTISPFDFQVGIDRIEEALSWSSEQLRSSWEEISSLLIVIFSCRSVVENWGDTHTRISFFDKYDVCRKSINYIKGISLFFNKKEAVSYKPII